MIFYELRAWKRDMVDRYTRFRHSRTFGYLIAALYLTGTALILGLTRALRFAMEHN